MAIVSIIASVAFILTLVGIPVALAIGSLVWLGAVVGIAAMAHRIGQWLERRTDSASPSLAYAAIGGFAVGLVLGSSEWLPVVGGLVEAGVSLVGLGALASSGMGSSSAYHGRSPSDARPPGLRSRYTCSPGVR